MKCVIVGGVAGGHKDGRDLIEPVEKYGVKLLSIGSYLVDIIQDIIFDVIINHGITKFFFAHILPN